MTLAEFEQSLKNDEPSGELSIALQALWWEAQGDAQSDWDKAHDVLQHDESQDGAWVHAYLHRKEGDPSNAAYWYRRAGQPVCTTSLPEEWKSIAEALL